jgi:hypothetical protein
VVPPTPEPAAPVAPAVPVEPPLLSLPQPTVETLDSMKPAAARPTIPKNALILNSFMSFSP